MRAWSVAESSTPIHDLLVWSYPSSPHLVVVPAFLFSLCLLSKLQVRSSSPAAPILTTVDIAGWLVPLSPGDTESDNRPNLSVITPGPCVAHLNGLSGGLSIDTHSESLGLPLLIALSRFSIYQTHRKFPSAGEIVISQEYLWPGMCALHRHPNVAYILSSCFMRLT